ncbi:VWA domain-containing protein [Rhodococcus sp. NPDC057135]|uniref:vWA domain-containing protein n=1 Tax=Rhodococcus sp. NPDC057135 TaxID=3346028 RepID=UPI003629C8D8
MRLRVAICIAATAIIAVGCSTQGSGGTQEVGGTQEAGGTQQATVAADPASEVSATAPTVIVLDASGSMKQDDAPGLRIDAAKNAIHTLVSGLPDESTLGLIAYGTSTGSSDAEKDVGCRDIKTVVPLGPLDRHAFAAGIDGLSASGYTPILSALQQAAAALPADGERTIILVSDGEDTCSPKPLCESTEAIPHDPGLTIHTIGFKLDAAASGQLTCIADATGGMAIDAANAAQLTARLAVASNPDSARERLSTSGFRNLRIGMTEGEARKVAGDLAPVSKTGTVVVE